MALSAAEQHAHNPIPDGSVISVVQSETEAGWLTPLQTQLRLASWLVNVTTELDIVLGQMQGHREALSRDGQQLQRIENGIVYGDRTWRRNKGVGSVSTIVMHRANEQLVIPKITNFDDAEAMLLNPDGYANMMNTYYARILRERGPDQQVGPFIKPGRLNIRHETCAHPFMKKGEEVTSKGMSAVQLYALALRYHVGSLAAFGVELGMPKGASLQKALV